MEFRHLGGSAFMVPALSLGTGTFGGATELFKAWRSSDVAEATRVRTGSQRRGLLALPPDLCGRGEPSCTASTP